MTNIGHDIHSADARRRQIRLVQALFAGAAAVATLALFSAEPSNPDTAVASGAVPALAATGRIIAINDDDVNNPSDGDIFTQNAQDQSTANGAGT
jgi:hypothetical protein